MKHDIGILEKAFNMKAVTPDDIEELFDMECFCYIAQYHDELTAALDLQRMRRTKFLAMVNSTIAMTSKEFNISEELASEGTKWFNEQDFWEVNEVLDT